MLGSDIGQIILCACSYPIIMYNYDALIKNLEREKKSQLIVTVRRTSLTSPSGCMLSSPGTLDVPSCLSKAVKPGGERVLRNCLISMTQWVWGLLYCSRRCKGLGIGQKLQEEECGKGMSWRKQESGSFRGGNTHREPSPALRSVTSQATYFSP